MACFAQARGVWLHDASRGGGTFDSIRESFGRRVKGVPADNLRMQLTMHVWAKNLRMALGMEPLEMHALMAQLVVLYEDLRIELKAASDFSDTSLEGNYRRNYFIRRTTGTLVENLKSRVPKGACGSDSHPRHQLLSVFAFLGLWRPPRSCRL